MQLIDRDRAVELYGRMGPAREVSGGSAANTIAGLAALGAPHRLRRQGQGRPARRDLRPRPAGAGRGLRDAAGAAATTRHETGRCMVLVSADGERSMNTYLGVSEFLAPADIDEAADGRGRLDLPRGLPLRRPRHSSPPSRRRSAPPRRAGGKVAHHPLRPLLRRAPPRRVPADDPRRRRPPRRQRARAEVALPDRRPRRGDGPRRGRGAAHRLHRRRRRRARPRPAARGCMRRRPRSRSSTPPAPATSSPPASCTASPPAATG